MQYGFDSIAGYAAEKEELMRLCEIFNHRETYEKRGAKMPKGVIFYGGAGTGKTLFARVMASMCNLKVYRIDAGAGGDGDSLCGVIRKTFDRAARGRAPAMIFFDEVDKVLPNVTEDYVTDRAKTVLAQLLTLIDGMDSARNIIFVATCNDYASLPPTFVRAGRIDKKIGLSLPDFASRRDILKLYARRSPCTFGMSMEAIAGLSSGFSCAALETFVNECILRSDEDGVISEALIKEKLHEIKEEDIPRQRSLSDDRAIACRNLGAFIVARSLNDGGYLLCLETYTVCNDFFNAVLSEVNYGYSGADGDDEDWEYDEEDFEEDEDDDDDEEEDEDDYVGGGYDQDEEKGAYYSGEDYLNAVTALLGGYAAQELFFGRTYDFRSDLRDAEKVLYLMCECGMFGIGRYFSESACDDGLYSEARLAETEVFITAKLQECYERARDIVKKNISLIGHLLPVFLRERILERKKCEKLLASLGGIEGE